MADNTAAALQLLQEFQQVQAHRAELYTQLSTGFRDFLGHGQEAVLAPLMQQITPGFVAVSKQVISIESNLHSVARPDLAGLLRQVQEREREKLRLTLSWQALRAAHASGRFTWQSKSDRPCLSTSHSAAQQQQHQQQELMSMLQRVQLQAAKQQDSGQSSIAANGNDVGMSNSDQQQQVEGFMSVKPGFYEQQLQRATAAAADADAAQGSSSQKQQLDHHQGHGCCMGHGHSHDHSPPDPLDSNGMEPTEAEYKAAVKEALQELDSCVMGINELLEEVREAVLQLQEDSAL